ncbi:MAG: hypothetical protein DME19_05260 [Verrucomicrobia bacterium]|nr:MAG: hypothetical protein DME19_05260 [Verrucomicrobiota bacterium]
MDVVSMPSEVPKNDAASLPEWRTASGFKGRLLLVDDDVSVRESLGRALGSEGYEMILAANGREAIDEFLRGYIDLVLLDLNVPVKGGWDVFERMTALNPLLPIIIITARSEQYELAATAGASALMEKPLSLPLLIGTIIKLLNEPVAKRLHRITSHRPILLSASS